MLSSPLGPRVSSTSAPLGHKRFQWAAQSQEGWALHHAAWNKNILKLYVLVSTVTSEQSYKSPYKARDRPGLLVLAPRPFQHQTSLVVSWAAAPTNAGGREEDPHPLVSPDRPSGKQSQKDMLILAVNKSTGEGSKINVC